MDTSNSKKRPAATTNLPDKANLNRMETEEFNESDDKDNLEVLRLRYWQHLINELLKNKQFRIPIHLAVGHEAAAVAMDREMESDDNLCLSHRNVAYNLARSKSLEVVLQHYRLCLPSQTDALMGSMNLVTADTGIAYTSSILGNNLAVAAGIAMHKSLIQSPGVVFVVTGDGALEEGVFWETLIFSRSHKLPLVIVIENNDFSMSSTIAQRRSAIDLSNVCTGVGYRYIHADGALNQSTREALKKARINAAQGMPTCVELSLTTFCQHAGPTPGWPEDPLRLSLENGLLVEATQRDPLHNIKMKIGETEFFRLSEMLIKDGQSV